MNIPILDASKILSKLETVDNPFFSEYFAFYSSWFGGIVKDPRLMLLPIDDHMVHRGDGVFEAMKSVGRSIYLFEEHLQRLLISAESINLQLPFALEQIKSIVLETLRAADQDDTIIRIFLSRGPGDFSVNPYDPVAAQLYVVVAKLKTPSPAKYENGVVIGKSSLPVKPGWLAKIKSCNYLPNVLMKKEAVDRGLDFVIGVNADNTLTESATENLLIVDKDGVIIHPGLDNILKGTIMIRACELAKEDGMPTAIRPIAIADLLSASEVFITGTSLNILPVVKFEDSIIGTGKPGPIAKKLNELMRNDIIGGPRITAF